MKKKPVIGEKIYVPTALYVYRGREDFAGGIAIIKSVKRDRYGTWIEIEEQPGTQYNWRYLHENQKKWEKEYGNDIAHPDPDYREEFNNPEADWR